MKALKVKLNLSWYQKLVLNTLSNEHRLLYNHLLEHAKNTGTIVGFSKECSKFRRENNLTIQYRPAYETCKTLINSVKSYLAKKKTDKAARLPYRFKSWKYFTTIQWRNCNFKLNDNILTIFIENHYIETAKVLEIQLPDYCKTIVGTLKTLQIKKEDDVYFAIFTYSEPKKVKTFTQEKLISIDPGVTNIATIYNPDKKEIIEIPNDQFHKQLEKRIEVIQSLRDKKKKYSRRYKRLAAIYKRCKKKLANKNKDFQHKVSKKIVDYCIENEVSKVVYGDIKTKKLVKDSKLAKDRGLNKSTQNQGTLSRFRTFIEYKVLDEGILFVRQNEAYTSCTNCLTNERFDAELKLSDRIVKLNDSLIFTRDGNGAVNIMKSYCGDSAIPIKGSWLAHLESVSFSRMLLDHDKWSSNELTTTLID
jgi:putative transposase